MRIAVTGSSGLLGRHVAAALVDAGHAVAGIDLAAPPAGATWAHVTADVTELGAMCELVQGSDAVVHIAAIPRPTGRAASEVLETNLGATWAAVEAARIAGAQRFVYASSFSVHGWPFFLRPITPAYLPIDEDHPIGAQDAYALSKWLGEEIVEAAVRGGAFAAVSLRMPWLQTPATFRPQIVPRLASGAAKDDLWAYLDARDAAAAFVAALTAPIDGHARLLLSAADSYADSPTAALLRETYPSVPRRAPLPGTTSLLDATRARALLGWAPRFSWRAYATTGDPP